MPESIFQKGVEKNGRKYINWAEEILSEMAVGASYKDE